MTDEEHEALDRIIEGLRPKFWERATIAILLPLSIFIWVAILYYAGVFLAIFRYPIDNLGPQ
jgi:hypothetical protein